MHPFFIGVNQCAVGWMFLALHGIRRKRLDNISKILKENGLAARVHGNTQRKPKHALSFSSTEYVVKISINVLLRAFPATSGKDSRIQAIGYSASAIEYN